MTTSIEILFLAVFPTISSIWVGEIPVPGPFVVSISLDIIVPDGMDCVETILFANFLKTGSSDDWIFFPG